MIKGQLRLLFCLMQLLLFQGVNAQDPVGKWSGVIKFQGTSLKIAFNINRDSTGYSASMDSPSQGVKGIPVDIIRLDTIIHLKLKTAGIVYEARWTSDDKWEGTFNQSGIILPLELVRTAINVKKPRPQEPKEPFPYLKENISIELQNGSVISGTLTIPDIQRKYPLVILISGSGAQNRDSEVFGHKPFLVLSDHLTRKGYAVFRYDDRGVGGSNGNSALATSIDFASDIQGVVKYFKVKQGIDPKRIGLLGHSEGGVIAPLVYQSTKDITFIILMAAPGIKCREVLLQQQYDIGKASGLDEHQLMRSKEINTYIYNTVERVEDIDKLQLEIRTYLNKELKIDNPMIADAQLDEFINSQLGMIKSPWFRFFITYNPESALRKIKCPVLAINGSKDLQVSAAPNLEGIEKALKRGGNKKAVVKEIEDVNHLFQECETGNISEYANIEQTISPKVLNIITDWISSLN